MLFRSAMVKASAYGNGSDEVARLLEYNHADYLAVAYSDEGIELRHAGIRLPIMVMNPEEASFDALQRYDLEPEIYSVGLLENLSSFLKKSENTEGSSDFGFLISDFGTTPAKIRNPKSEIEKGSLSAKIHLKLDTGMHRLGFEPHDIQRLNGAFLYPISNGFLQKETPQYFGGFSRNLIGFRANRRCKFQVLNHSVARRQNSLLRDSSP